MSRLSCYLKKYRWNLIVGPFCKWMEAVFELIIPLIVSDMIDNALRGENASVSNILAHGGGILALATAGLCFSLVCQYTASRCSQGFGTELRDDLFRHILTLSPNQIDTLTTPSLITRMTADIDQLQVAVAMLIRLVVRAPFLVIGATVMAFILQPKLALILLVVAPLLAALLWGVMHVTIPRYRRIQQQLDGITDIARENLNGVRVVRAFARQEHEQQRFNQATDSFARSSIVVGRVSALLNPGSFLLIQLAVAAILYFSGGMVDAGEMTQGEITAFVSYLMQISLALVIVANLVILYTKSFASAKRIVQVLETQPDIDASLADNTPEDHAPDTPVLQFRNVSYHYGGEDALHDLTLDVYRGQTVGIIGGTGSGKTTLVQLIPRFYDPTQGQILLYGKDLRHYSPADLRKHIGLVPQQVRLFAGTVRSNLLWGNPDATDEDLRNALHLAQADFVWDNPEGLDQVVLAGGKNFSGGQRQRLTIARALVRRPSVLILDDSMSALDYATDLALRRALATLPDDTVQWIVSQRAGSICHADQIVVLDHGNVVGIGKHDALYRDCAVYREIWDSQHAEEVDA